MNLITKVKAKFSTLLGMLKTSQRIDRLEKATFDQLDNAITRIEQMGVQIHYLRKEVERLESRVEHVIDYVEDTDLGEAVSDAISDLDMSDYINTDDIVDSVLAAIAERISEGAKR